MAVRFPDRFAALAMAAGVALVAVAMPPGASAVRPGASAQRGRHLVEANCGRCHATGRTGDSPNAAAPRFRRLHDRYPVESLAESMSEGLLNGHGTMPSFTFSNRQAADIIVYLRSIQTRQG